MPPQGADAALSDTLARLLEHFRGRENEPKAWDDLWKGNEFLPWDQGIPNPALVDLLNDRKDLIGDPTNGKKRKKALVPGCGKGYDCLLLASYGYDAYGLESSSHAVREAEKWEEDHGKDYEMKNEALGRGQVKFVYGDFFAEEWEKSIPALRDEDQGGFDLIYDYTVGCFRFYQLHTLDTDRCSFCLLCHPR